MTRKLLEGDYVFEVIRVVGRGPQAIALAEVLGAGAAKTTVVDPDDLAALAGSHLVVEATGEDAATKARVLAAIAVAVDAGTVLAVSTQALAVTDLALTVPEPWRVVGLRLTQLGGRARGLLEVTGTMLTDPGVLAGLQEMLADLQVRCLTVPDRPGALLPLLLLPYLNAAVGMYEARYASREDIDAAMRFGCGHPQGPLTLLDEIGLDTTLAALSALHERTADHRHAPAPLLAQLVAAGRTGVAAGAGLYSYDEAGRVVEDDLTPSSPAAAASGRPVRSIGVIGTGTMASAIIEVCATSGFDVVFRARTPDKVAGVQRAVESALDKAVAKGRREQESRDGALARITGTTELRGLADCDLVIEAVVEDLTVKQELFAELDRVCKPGAVLSTTTSSLPVVEIGRVTSRPGDVIGMHWFNPATVMKLVEVVPTVATAAEVTATVLEVCARTDKHAVQCADRPGFIVNALLFPLLNDAVRACEAGLATRDEMDTAVTAGLGFPLGPFALIDVVGLDVTLAIQQTLHASTREPSHAPAPALAHLVTAGALGRKSGRGMRTY